jgi:hypothetical protein
VILFERQDWMSDANCRGIDPEYFHPARGVSVEHLREVCAECVVIGPCREMGIRDHTLQGFLGGMSERQRRDERQRRRRLSVRSERADRAFLSLREMA